MDDNGSLARSRAYGTTYRKMLLPSSTLPVIDSNDGIFILCE
jgi:hypothetical protein